MATVVWKGGAAAVAQVNTWTFANAYSANDTVTVVIGQKSYTYTLTTGVIATFLPLLQAVLAGLSATAFPEFAEITWGNTSTTITGTAVTAGVPFTATFSTNSAAGTINGGASSTGTATTASSGPNDWSTANNWSTGTVPAGADTVYVEASADDIKYGLSQSGVTLTLLEVRASFTGTLGLPIYNTAGTQYPEYRTRYLTISATTLNIGDGDGQGSGRLLVNVGSNACTMTVRRTASGLDTNLEALQWKGTNAGNAINIYEGQVAIAGFLADTATVATLQVGWDQGQSSDAQVRCGAGTTLTTITQTGGQLTINSAATTITRHGGSLTVRGTGAITTLTSNSGTVDYRGSGTITTYTGGPASVLDCTKDQRGRTITNSTLLAGATVIDSGATITWTNPTALSRCKLSDVSIDVGYNRNVAVT